MRPCPCCESRRAEVIRRLDWALFDDVPLQRSGYLSCCLDCAMLFVDIPTGQGVLSAYYQGNRHYAHSDTAGTGGASVGELLRYERLWSLLADTLPPARPVLDIGCGKGGFLRYLAERTRAPLLGVEPSAASRGFFDETEAIRIVASTDDMGAGREPAAVVLTHVLEHLGDPLDELRRLVALSAPDTRFFCEVPNTARLPGSDHPWHWLYFEHVNHFDTFSLRRLLQAAGLRVEYEGSWSFLPGGEDPEECLYALCRPRGRGSSPAISKAEPDFTLARSIADVLRPGPLPEARVAELVSLGADGETALWGLSQYAMLVLGMHPPIAGSVRWLFDNSPAKQGRKIGGHAVLPASDLGVSIHPGLLLIPWSGYLEAMSRDLDDKGFSGRREVI